MHPGGLLVPFHSWLCRVQRDPRNHVVRPILHHILIREVLESDSPSENHTEHRFALEELVIAQYSCPGSVLLNKDTELRRLHQARRKQCAVPPMAGSTTPSSCIAAKKTRSEQKCAPSPKTHSEPRQPQNTITPCSPSFFFAPGHLVFVGQQVRHESDEKKAVTAARNTNLLFVPTKGLP